MWTEKWRMSDAANWGQFNKKFSHSDTPQPPNQWLKLANRVCKAVWDHYKWLFVVMYWFLLCRAWPSPSNYVCLQPSASLFHSTGSDHASAITTLLYLSTTLQQWTGSIPQALQSAYCFPRVSHCPASQQNPCKLQP